MPSLYDWDRAIRGVNEDERSSGMGVRGGKGTGSGEWEGGMRRREGVSGVGKERKGVLGGV